MEMRLQMDCQTKFLKTRQHNRASFNFQYNL
eukprot:COSAG02_NODE_72348_length_186_cov_33.321839_1_plen_30_part_10